jgi:hypothetical protein
MQMKYRKDINTVSARNLIGTIGRYFSHVVTLLKKPEKALPISFGI